MHIEIFAQCLKMLVLFLPADDGKHAADVINASVNHESRLTHNAHRCVTLFFEAVGKA